MKLKKKKNKEETVVFGFRANKKQIEFLKDRNIDIAFSCRKLLNEMVKMLENQKK